jgi:hypothetical protein
VSDEDVMSRLQALITTSVPVAGDDADGRLQAAKAKIAQLEVAVDHRTIIGQAVGILIERYRLDAKTAFEALARVSSQTNRKVVDIARELSETGRSAGFGEPSRGRPRPPAV